MRLFRILSCLVAVIAIAGLSLPAHAKLAANKLSANKLAANSWAVNDAAGRGEFVDIASIELPSGVFLSR
jgi:hypothetical protein